MIGRDRRARRDRATSNKEARHRFQTPAAALTIAGSDSSAGAGIQADLKTFSALGVYALTAVTCVVAEIPGKVSRIEVVTAAMVREQIELLLKNFKVGAIKTGLLCSAEIISAVAQAIEDSQRMVGEHIPLVIDPVMIATSGHRLVEPGAIDVYKTQLFPLATLITPNLDEAGLLLQTTIKNRKQMQTAAKALVKKYHASVLLKGGHIRGRNAIDVLFHHDKLTEFSAPFVANVATHGTGCTYSAAITAGLASHLSLEQSIGRAKRFVTKSIACHFRWKHGFAETVDALNHSI